MANLRFKLGRRAVTIAAMTLAGQSAAGPISQFPTAAECQPAPNQQLTCWGMKCFSAPDWKKLSVNFSAKTASLDGSKPVKLKQLAADSLSRTQFLNSDGCPFTLTFNNRDGKLAECAQWVESCR